MSEIIISSYFADNSGPKTGLTPTIRIWEVTSSGESLIVGSPCGSGSATDGNMTEMADCGSPASSKDGFYRYTFDTVLGYDTAKTYVARIDGGNTLSSGYRYQSTSIGPLNSVEGMANAIWNESAANHPSSSPETMGGRLNSTYDNVETIRVTDIPALFSLMDLLRKYDTNRTRIDSVNNTLIIYDDDCTTVLRTFRLLDHSGLPSSSEVCERTSINGVADGSSPSGFTGSDGYPTCS
jgi:hypothetical protein